MSNVANKLKDFICAVLWFVVLAVLFLPFFFIWVLAVCFNLLTKERPILPEGYWEGFIMGEFLEYTSGRS